MKTMASYCLFVFALASLSTYNVVGLTIRRSSSASDVDALRKAVNNAFDALSKVHDAIGNLQDDALHSTHSDNYKNNEVQIKALDDTNMETKRSNQEEKSSDRSNEKIERSSKAEKKSLKSSSIDDSVLERSEDEKFIEQVRELEDVMSKRNKEDDMENAKKDEAEEVKEASAKKQENKRERGSNEVFTEGPQKLISLFGKGKRASSDRVSMATDDLSDEDIKESVDFLVDVLKEGLQTEAKDSKLKDFLTTMLEKDATGSVTDAKQIRRKDQTSSLKTTAEEMKRRKDESSSAASSREEIKRKASSLSADQGFKTKKSLQTAEKRNRNAELNAVSSSFDAGKSATKSEITTAEKKETRKRESSSSKKSVAAAAAALQKDRSATLRSKSKRGENELSKRHHMEGVMRDESTSSRRFEDEVQELVNLILKRKELLKREKLKMALADMFREMEGKVMDEASNARDSAHAYSERSAEKEGGELRKFAEDMLLLGDKAM